MLSTPVQRPILGRLIAASGVIAIAVATLTPAGYGPTGSPYCVVCGPLGGVDVILNLMLFVPLGLGLALLGARGVWAIGSMSVLSFGIELLQLFIIPNRDASLGDILMNSTGGALGFVLGAHLDRIVVPTPTEARRLLLSWCTLWLAIQIVAAYSVVPRATRGQYYGQLAEPFGTSAVTFDGDVLHSTLDTVVVPDGKFSESGMVAELLARRGGVRVRAHVVATAPSDVYVPIIRIVDERQNELLAIGQEGRDVVFGIRTGADVLRLRSPRYRLPDVFAAGDERRTDTVALDGSLARSGVRMTASHRGGSISAAFLPGPSQSWMLAAPFSADMAPGWRGITAGVVWLALLAFGIGYWFAFARSSALRTSDTLVLTFLCVGTILVGLAVSRAALAVAPAKWWEWLVVGVGVGFGGWFGQVLKAHRHEL